MTECILSEVQKHLKFGAYIKKIPHQLMFSISAYHPRDFV